MAGSPEGALAGLRVVELAGLGPAQHGAMMLADLGADVTRVDRPRDVPDEPTGASSELLGRGRRSVALDLKHPAGLAAARRLIDGADVLIDPYRPGVAERLGLGPQELLAANSRLIFARMTGWGQEGPLSAAAGHDLNYAALAGAVHAMGAEDDVPPVPLNLVADFGGGGMLLAFGIVTALLERERSGLGQVLDVAMVDGVASMMTGILQLRASARWTDRRGANWLQGAAPWYRPYRTADGGFVTVGPLEPQFYAELLSRLGLRPDDWPQWDESRWPALAAELEEVFAGAPRAAWEARLAGTDTCFAPALELGELLTHPHLRARETYVELDDVVQPSPVPRFSRSTPPPLRRAPWPGQDSVDVLREAGLEDDELNALLRERVTAQLHERPNTC